MPKQSPPRSVYWDSCVLISYIEATPGRMGDLAGLLQEAHAGEIEIVTSTASIVEVAFAEEERSAHRLDEEAHRKIESLWTPPSPIKLVEFHALIAADARQLMRKVLPDRWALKPLDAIHLATAARHRVASVHTYDKGLHKYSTILGFPVVEPEAAQPVLE
jgi:predicted nucleic acid-binding protein